MDDVALVIHGWLIAMRRASASRSRGCRRQWATGGSWFRFSGGTSGPMTAGSHGQFLIGASTVLSAQMCATLSSKAQVSRQTSEPC